MRFPIGKIGRLQFSAFDRRGFSFIVLVPFFKIQRSKTPITRLECNCNMVTSTFLRFRAVSYRYPKEFLLKTIILFKNLNLIMLAVVIFCLTAWRGIIRGFRPFRECCGFTVFKAALCIVKNSFLKLTRSSKFNRRLPLPLAII